jgi:DNA-binding CsgD family transcriptional regulator
LPSPSGFPYPAGGGAIAQMGTRVTFTPDLLEREHELEALSAAVADARDGAGGAVLIQGPAGVGKSRLLARARADAAGGGMEVLEARGASLEREFAFGVARQLFEAVVVSGDESERRRLFGGAAGLSERLFGDAGPELVAQGGDAAFGALHGLYWLTVNLADRGPVLLAVDDVHWADIPSLRFLSYISRRLEGLPILLVAAGRIPDPEAGSPIWEEFAGEESALVLRPGPLSDSAAADLVRDRLEGADEEFCRACHEATGGNPLFLRELVAALEEAEIAPTAQAASAVTQVGPPSVSRFVLHRLERLGPAAMELARTIAVLGDAADVRVVSRAAGLEIGETRELVDRLVETDVLAPARRLAFAHPIVQAAIYESLLPGDRAARHAAAAELLAAEGAPVERVAAHLLAAAPAGDAARVATLRAAAARAAERGAPGTAATYLRRAFEEPPPEAERAEILTDLGRWELPRQEFAAAEEHLLDALATPAPAAVHLQAATWLGRLAIASGRSQTAATALDALLAELEAVDEELSLEVEAELTNLCMNELSLRRLLPERLERFRRRAEGNPSFERVALVYLSVQRFVRGEPAADAADELEAALADGPLVNEPAMYVAINGLRYAERFDASARWLELGLEAARARGLPIQIAMIHGERARQALVCGSVGDAQLEAQAGLDLIGERHFALPRLAAVAIEAALERGELEAAAAAEGRGRAEGERERLFIDEYLTARGRLRIARGGVREGIADMLRVGELHEAYGNRMPADWRPYAAAALMALGDDERARDLARNALERARTFGTPRALGLALRTSGRLLGGSEGLAQLEEAVAVLESSPARLELAYALGDLGAELVRRRRRRDGRDTLRRALDEAVRCGATALAERVRGEIGAGGGRPPRLELTGVNALTPAERRVCELAARDSTNREIAQTLFVTEKTVELHLTNAYRKLGIRSRFQLADALSA